MYRKKYVAFMAIVLFLFSFNLSNTEAKSTSSLEPLHLFQDFFNKEDLAVTEWQVMAREQIISTEALSPKAFIYNLYPNANIKKETSEHSVKYFVEYVHKNKKVSEQISVVQEKNNKGSIQLFYLIKGEEFGLWEEKFIKENIFRAISQYFTKNPSFFTCMEAQVDDIIKSNFVTEKFTQFTNMHTLKMLNEDNFTTVSGFIPNLQVERIPISDTEDMNVQLAVRHAAETGTTITIGTPILTVEY
ncbi:YwmB family TATA-box binding protein [Salirhabdus sp. Marseille-P4669]|uniref:YwmB family TATA-box binding protein n=1 Tax=Salirhabdus sp. Marseille-P4669 TaxID=2042310 RepID=UPI000C7AA104|nr:YwmB family TATA-box binding protein [Salirhabdus sp. Marseille-P4669]